MAGDGKQGHPMFPIHRAAQIAQQTTRLANRAIKFGFIPSPETGLLNYFPDDLPDDLKKLTHDGFEYVPPEIALKGDVLILTAHGKDYSKQLWGLRQKAPHILIAVWLWDNHLGSVNNLRMSVAADYVFASHHYKADYLANPVSVMGHHVPLCSAQWSVAEAARIFRTGIGAPRSNKLLVNYVDYPFSWRSPLLKKLKSDFPEADVLLMDPNDRTRYFEKTREERAQEWLSYKTTIILPVDKDISTRVFDGLLAGQVILVPDQIVDFDDVVPPDVQQRLGIVRLPDYEITTIARCAEQALRLYDEGGEAAAVARHTYALENHMLVHRIKSMLENIRSVANGDIRPTFVADSKTSAGLYLC
jgi:hypothetical protein